MVKVFENVPLLQTIDPNGKIEQMFIAAAASATQLGNLAGGFPYWLGEKVSRRVLQNTFAQFGLDYIAWALFLGIVRGVGSYAGKKFIKSLMEPEKDGEPKPRWDGVIPERKFVDEIDKILSENDPIRALKTYKNKASIGEGQVCDALIGHYEGDADSALDWLEKVAANWQIDSNELRQFIIWRRARAKGLAGAYGEAEYLLRELIHDPRPVNWLQHYSLRDLAHYQIQYAWTRDTKKNWTAVRSTVRQASKNLENRRLPQRLETIRRSIREFEAIIRFAESPTVKTAGTVANCVDSYRRMDPTYGAYRTTPLAALYLRAGDPKRALDVTIENSDIVSQNKTEHGVSLLVQSQAYARMKKHEDAFSSSTKAVALLAPQISLVEELFRPRRFSRIARMYNAMYNQEKTPVEHVVAFVPGVLLRWGGLYGPFVVDRPSLRPVRLQS